MIQRREKNQKSADDNPLDSIIVGYQNDANLIHVANVGKRFCPEHSREVFENLRGLKIATCPFVNLPETNALFTH